MKYIWATILIGLLSGGHGECLQVHDKTVPSKAEQLVKIEKVRFAAGPTGVGELFTPGVGQPGSWPGVVVVPDSPGLNDTVRAQSKSLSAHGYLVIAVDLYDGRTPSSSKEAEEWMNALPLQETVSKLQGAMGFLQNWMSDPTKVGVVAWGSGGTLALRLAAAENNVKAVVVNYGPLSQDGTLAARITAPILVNAGALDGSTSPEQIASFVGAMKLPRSKKDVKMYSDAGYDFEDAQNGRDYRPVDAADADNRTVTFLAKWLKGR